MSKVTKVSVYELVHLYIEQNSHLGLSHDDYVGWTYGEELGEIQILFDNVEDEEDTYDGSN